MTVRERIASIRLSEMIRKNPEYAKQLGISILGDKADKTKKEQKKENSVYSKERI